MRRTPIVKRKRNSAYYRSFIYQKYIEREREKQKPAPNGSFIRRILKKITAKIDKFASY